MPVADVISLPALTGPASIRHLSSAWHTELQIPSSAIANPNLAMAVPPSGRWYRIQRPAKGVPANFPISDVDRTKPDENTRGGKGQILLLPKRQAELSIGTISETGITISPVFDPCFPCVPPAASAGSWFHAARSPRHWARYARRNGGQHRRRPPSAGDGPWGRAIPSHSQEKAGWTSTRPSLFAAPASSTRPRNRVRLFLHQLPQLKQVIHVRHHRPVKPLHLGVAGLDDEELVRRMLATAVTQAEVRGR